MKQVTLGSKVYFIPEEEDLYLFEDLYEWPPEVLVQDETGQFVAIKDDFTIAWVKVAVALAPSKTAVPDWRHKFHHLLEERIKGGVDVTEAPTKNGGKCWSITLTKEAVFAELAPEISLDTFKRQVQPKTFKHRGLPLKWASQGGRPKNHG